MLNRIFEILKIISLSKLTRIIIFSLFVIFLTLGLFESLLLSPEDYIQSDAVRIMYVHVPAAWISLGIFSFIAFLSLGIFIFKNKNFVIIAKSFAGIFYRNAINLGLPVFTLPSEPSLPKKFVDGSFVNFDFDSTTLNLEQPSLQVKLDPLPKFLRELITDGGLVSHLEKRFSEK